MFQKNISILREFLKKNNLDYFLICATDEYLNEYIPKDENPRYLLSAFSGSTGDMLIGHNEAFLFVDGRYHKQADEQVDHKTVKVVKLMLNNTQKQAIEDILKDKKNLRIGIPSSKMRYMTFCNLQKDLPDVEFVEFDKEPDLAGFKNCSSNAEIRTVPISIVKYSADEKVEKLGEELGDKTLIITKLDEIAYLTNLRSSQIPYFSAFKAKALLKKDKCYLFTDAKELKIGGKFEVLPEKEFFEYLKKENNFMAVKSSINLMTYRMVENKNIEFIDRSPIALMKAVKNECEIAHMKDCFERADKVMIEISQWLNDLENISELDFSNKVEELFLKYGANSLSFSTIASFGNNTASIHYSTPSADVKLKENDIILLDCGGYYEGGYSTDATRVFFKGDNPSKEQKEVYTTVLRAFLNGLYYPLQKGSTGFDIDKKVRDITEQCSLKTFHFMHSTGHGVGISVHEAPPFLGPSESAKKQLLPGMCFSIEPGLYDSEKFGVRIENTVYTDDTDGKLQIKSFSKAPFEKKLIDYSLLSEQEKIWLEDYEAQCKK